MTQRTDVTITTADGTCPAVVVAPDGEGAWPAVIMFMDAGGVRPALIQMAEHLAGMGYVTLLPELYYRHGTYEPFDFATAFSDPDERNRLMSMVASVTKEMAAAYAGAFLDFLSGHAQVAGTKVGSTGYCMAEGCRSPPLRITPTASSLQPRSTGAGWRPIRRTARISWSATSPAGSTWPGLRTTPRSLPKRRHISSRR